MKFPCCMYCGLPARANHVCDECEKIALDFEKMNKIKEDK